MAIRTVFIGYGRSAQELHAPAIGALGEDFMVTGVFDPNPESGQRAASLFGCEVFQSYADALDASADLAIVLTRNDQHAGMAADFLKHGKHVLVTKPWALHEREALDMIAARGDRMLFPWLPCRFASDLEALRRVVRSGELGKVFLVRRAACTFGRRADWQTQTRFGGGYLLNWGPHLVDQAMELAGARAVSVWGETRRVINPGDAEDSFLAVMRLENGVTAQAEYAVGAPGCLPDWLVQGDRGTAWIRGGTLTVTTATQPDMLDPSAYRNDVKLSTREEAIDQARVYGDATEIYACVARAIRGEAPYPVSCESALMLTRTLDAIRQSANTGELVRL